MKCFWSILTRTATHRDWPLRMAASRSPLDSHFFWDACLVGADLRANPLSIGGGGGRAASGGGGGGGGGGASTAGGGDGIANSSSSLNASSELLSIIQTDTRGGGMVRRLRRLVRRFAIPISPTDGGVGGGGSTSSDSEPGLSKLPTPGPDISWTDPDISCEGLGDVGIGGGGGKLLIDGGALRDPVCEWPDPDCGQSGIGGGGGKLCLSPGSGGGAGSRPDPETTWPDPDVGLGLSGIGGGFVALLSSASSRLPGSWEMRGELVAGVVGCGVEAGLGACRSLRNSTSTPMCLFFCNFFSMFSVLTSFLYKHHVIWPVACKLHATLLSKNTKIAFKVKGQGHSSSKSKHF